MELITSFFKQDFAAIIIGAFFVMAGFNMAVSIIGKFSVSIGKPIKWIKKKDADHDLIERTVNEVSGLKKKHDEDILESHNEVTALVNDLKVEMKQLGKKIDTLKEETDKRFNDNETKENKRVQADIKDKVSQIYRRSKVTKTISSIELDTLKDLIASYEEHGGHNSFIHSLVEPEMYTWTVIDD